MEIKVSTRHGQISEQTREKITSKVGKLTRLFDRLTGIEITIDLENRDTPIVDGRVSAEHKHGFVATGQLENLLASVDTVLHRLEQQLRRHKEKTVDRHRNGGSRRRESVDDSETIR